MQYTINITNLQPLADSFESWEGKWEAYDSNHDDITYLVEVAIPHAIQAAGFEDNGAIRTVELFTKEGHSITSDCKEGSFIAST